MAIEVIVNSQPIQYPTSGDSPGWGPAATDFAVEVANVLNSLVAPTDILTTAFTINNNVTTFTDILGLSFNTGLVRSAYQIPYAIYRVSTANPSGHAETGLIQAVYDNAAASGSKWAVSIDFTGDSGVTFNMTDLGQMQYKSSDINATGYSGLLNFSASTLGQT